MNVGFHLISPGEQLDPHEIAKQVEAEQLGMTDAVCDAVNLADSAAAFFCGMFPVESPPLLLGRQH